MCVNAVALCCYTVSFQHFYPNQLEYVPLPFYRLLCPWFIGCTLLCMYAHVDYVHYSIGLADFTLSARSLHTASHLRYIGVVGQSTEPIRLLLHPCGLGGGICVIGLCFFFCSLFHLHLLILHHRR